MPTTSVSQFNDCSAMGVYPSSVEFFLALPILLLLLGFNFKKLKLPNPLNSWGDCVSMPMEVVSATRIWGCMLIVFGAHVYYLGFNLSFPFKIYLLLFGISGVLIEKPLGQAVFHICTSCSWFGLFDLMLYCKEQDGIDVIFSSRAVYAAYIFLSIFIRYSQGNNWLYSNLSYCSIGFVVIISYFWLLELPSCVFFQSGIFCNILGKSSSPFLHGGLYHRLSGIGIAISCHVVLNLFLSLSIGSNDFYMTSDDIIDTLNTKERTKEILKRFESVTKKENKLDVGDLNNQKHSTGDISNVEREESESIPLRRITEEELKITQNGGDVPIIFNSPSNESPLKEEFNVKSVRSSSVTSNCTNDSTGSSDHRMGATGDKIRIPSDSVEISEEEALEIIQFGLKKSKSKRAVGV